MKLLKGRESRLFRHAYSYIMLNSRLKKEAIGKLKRESNRYVQAGEVVRQKNAVKLLNIRIKSSEFIKDIEKSYVNTLANTPKEFQATFSEAKIRYAEVQ